MAQEINNVHVFSGGRLIYQAHACRVMVMLVQQQCLVTGRQSMALIKPARRDLAGEWQV